MFGTHICCCLYLRVHELLVIETETIFGHLLMCISGLCAWVWGCRVVNTWHLCSSSSWLRDPLLGKRHLPPLTAWLLLASPHTRPAHMLSSPYDPIYLSLKTESSRDTPPRQTRTVGHPIPSPTWPCCSVPGQELWFPPAEEVAGPRVFQNSHSADPIPGLTVPQAPSPAGMGCATLLRQLPREWAQHLPPSFQGLGLG